MVLSLFMPPSRRPLLLHPLNDKPLHVLIPAQQHIHPRVGKVAGPETATHPGDKSLICHQPRGLKRPPGKLHPSIVGHGRVGPIPEARPVPDGYKAEPGRGIAMSIFLPGVRASSPQDKKQAAKMAAFPGCKKMQAREPARRLLGWPLPLPLWLQASPAGDE